MRATSTATARISDRQTSCTVVPSRVGTSVVEEERRMTHAIRLLFEITKAPEPPGPSMRSTNGRLLQRVVDRGELVVQVRAETVHDRDDRQRNAGRDEAVFDSGGAGLILHETRNQVLHKLNSMYTWLL